MIIEHDEVWWVTDHYDLYRENFPELFNQNRPLLDRITAEKCKAVVRFHRALAAARGDVFPVQWEPYDGGICPKDRLYHNSVANCLEYLMGQFEHGIIHLEQFKRLARSIHHYVFYIEKINREYRYGYPQDRLEELLDPQKFMEHGHVKSCSKSNL